ncbi:hypothetical protein HCG48_15730 [Oxynema aestuarii AP17]|jgi:hypothetical protein|uniref:CP12 domain-containing protein n=2 Tax=Oxynema TaxID=1492710 RepID=A0A6H1U1F5_9CYAN|nr:hypothetical protein HCG48_15730 [Oxynema aestuarii AP17]RMH76683.1 MAG: hypothetical protein D6680_07580 [Cyanobacteria bacterium J007]
MRSKNDGFRRIHSVKEPQIYISGGIHLMSPTFASSATPLGVSPYAEKTLGDRIDDAIAEARAITDEKGVESRESAVAWDIVEELLSASAHRREKLPKNAFEVYCSEHPEAQEARMYDV